ncbi:MAG: hypothetical protein Q4C54_05340 [Clostridia bacterium]|nr:hypothetical protein [Clostridia bacterium]
MKKVIAIVMALSMLLCGTALAEVKLGQVDYAAHGDKCFAVITAAVDGDTIVGAIIDEFQFMAPDGAVGVPNSDKGFGESYPEGKVLISKRANNELYSGNMATKAGATTMLADGYKAIEDYCTGKTIAELEEILAGTEPTAMVDAVTGCTLVDTYGYVSGILEAAKAAQ